MPSQSTLAAPTAYDTGLAALQRSRGVVTGLTAELSDEQCLAQPCADANHVLWQLGHLTFADNLGLSLSDRQPPVDDAWAKLFGFGSTISSDPKHYPPLSEVRAAFDEARSRLLAWFASLSEAELAEPLPENLSSFAATRVALMTSLAGHEMMHAGQITVVRKSLQLPRRFM